MKPLCVLNTRPLGQNQALSEAMRQIGAKVIELPALAIHATPLTWLDTLPD